MLTITLQHLDFPRVITAIGALGTAAFGLVDASKALGGGVNYIGFSGIRKTATLLTPGAPGANALSQAKIIATLKANWFNGTRLPDQKAIAKSLIKLNLSPANAPALAAETGVDPAALTAIAANIAAAIPIAAPLNDVYARFDLIVTAILDETYQHADNVYRNWTRTLAGAVAVVLAIAAGQMLDPSLGVTPWQCALVGLLAVPLAPIAKDLSSALATAVNALQVVKKP